MSLDDDHMYYAREEYVRKQMTMLYAQYCIRIYFMFINLRRSI